MDKGDALKFWVNRQIARKVVHKFDILYAHTFDKVDWEGVHSSLWRTPRMFQIWECKQVMGIAPANANIPWDKTIDPLCPTVRLTSINHPRGWREGVPSRLAHPASELGLPHHQDGGDGENNGDVVM